MKKILEVKEFSGRLDAGIAKLLPELSRGEARRACEDGRVRLNTRRSKAGVSIKPGDVIEIETLPPAAARPEIGESYLAEHPNWRAIYEDDDLIVISKPRAMASIRLRYEDPVTLADCIAARYPSCREGSNDPRESGLVQRLDFYTSGLVMACKSAAAWEFLHEALVFGKVEKTYLALIEGTPAQKSYVITAPLVAVDNGKNMRTAWPAEVADAQMAESKVNILKELPGNMAIARVSSFATKRHQVRVHLQHIGHPLVGDDQYGSTRRLSELSNRFEAGFLLQAESITFTHPTSGEETHFSEPGEDFTWLLQ